ncbi:molybdenum cofactor biosynthesis protein MoaE [Actibacterium sp. XHP0104]|uniref:molybdenum cofactor biosynthesis protein MoaE n=1 Tax=Actibacterium sp. XHP0104 TaxID=2984335 RepID=UPI0021E8583F|nr:molybdenum cofactor biosynthesis protein MoaE [Actibacterium sp. XHP0104]MCV2883007.1 molybdenum cofactor biosynthesis protein MoaE [Actibacterium sp. XHP0104]
MDIRVQSAPFDFGAEAGAFATGHDNAGAVVTFAGIVRDDTGSLQRMVIEHYPGMTERALEKIAREATGRWDLKDCLIIHRHGDLAVGEMIMMVATAARHRKAAFEAAEYLMDFLKSRAPFWKKEITGSGTGWVASKDEDEAALGRWSKE